VSSEEKSLSLALTAAGFVLSDHAYSQVYASAQGNEAAASDDGGALLLTLGSGPALRLPAEQLRVACRCAHCRRAQLDGVFPDRFPSVAIMGVAPVGHYAVNLEFSDGHARGIYPWSYLAELAANRPA
jgi:DUF971 family protein